MTTEASIPPKRASRSPQRFFLTSGLTLAVLFLPAHLAGWREHTSFLSGTTGDTGMDFQTSAFLGALYILLYLACVVLAPILVLAAGILALWKTK